MISPRSNETAAVVEILESGDHDDAASMAKAIVKAVAEQLQRRETFVIFPPDCPFGYGPYWSETDAARAWKKEIGSSFTGQARLLRAFSWSVQPELNAGCECGHVKEQHVIPGPKNKPGKPSQCGLIHRGEQCPCPSFSPRKVPA